MNNLSNLSETATQRRPDFICVGAQKAGTTWLYRELGKHPGIWLSYKKEMHFFDREPHYLSSSYLYYYGLIKRLSNRNLRGVLLRGFRHILIRLLRTDFVAVKWLLKYYFGRPSLDWYRRLFPQNSENLVRGEITPTYSLLEKSDADKVVALFPNLKILIILRDPVDRTWSQIRFKSSNKGMQTLSEKEVLDYVNEDRAGVLDRSNYRRMLENWIEAAGRDNTHIVFFDDITLKPQETLIGIVRFLGLNPDKAFLDNVQITPANVSGDYSMPDSVLARLKDEFDPQIEFVEALVGPVPENWKHNRN